MPRIVPLAVNVLLGLALAAASPALAHPERAFLGVGTTEEIDHPEGGARITRVVPDSAAERAGLEPGDIVVGVDGRTVRGPRGLSKALEGHEPGDRIEVAAIRDGSERSFDVELGELPRLVAVGGGRGFVHASDCDGGDCGVVVCDDGDCAGVGLFSRFGARPLLGVQIVDTTAELRRHLGGGDDRGVLIGKVVPDSSAEQAGIQVGDLVVEVAGETVDSAGDIGRAIRDRAGETFDVEVIRDGAALRLSVTLPEPEEREFLRPRRARPAGFSRGVGASARAYERAVDSWAVARSRGAGARDDAYEWAVDAYRAALRGARESSREQRRRRMELDRLRRLGFGLDDSI
jgi:serine protease Do